MKIAIAVFVLLIVGLAAAVVFISKPASGLPGYATTNTMIKEAYTFAVESPQQLDGVSCYCGCMQHLHDGRIHKRGLLDCFTKGDGSFDKHASDCDMCIKDSLQVKQMSLDGKSKDVIKATIDAKYAGQTTH